MDRGRTTWINRRTIGWSAAFLSLGVGAFGVPLYITEHDKAETNDSTDFGDGGQGGAILPPTAGTAQPTAPTSTQEVTSSAPIDLAPSPSFFSRAPTKKPELRSHGPVVCSIDTAFSEDRQEITIIPSITGDTPNPDTGYIFIDRDDNSDFFEAHLDMDEPFVIKNNSSRVIIYYAGVEDMQPEYRPTPGDPSPRLDIRIILGAFGYCGMLGR